MRQSPWNVWYGNSSSSSLRHFAIQLRLETSASHAARRHCRCHRRLFARCRSAVGLSGGPLELLMRPPEPPALIVIYTNSRTVSTRFLYGERSAAVAMTTMWGAVRCGAIRRRRHGSQPQVIDALGRIRTEHVNILVQAIATLSLAW